MTKRLVYVELKTGFDHDGPAWIGHATTSKSGLTIYFDGLAFKRLGGQGIRGNYYEANSGDEYWISGVKRDNWDRHWAGSGKIQIDRAAVSEYLSRIGATRLPKNITKVDLAPPVRPDGHHEAENAKLDGAESITDVPGKDKA